MDDVLFVREGHIKDTKSDYVLASARPQVSG
jgi:hypothetical protein